MHYERPGEISLAHLSTQTRIFQDPVQCAYHPGTKSEDTIIYLLQSPLTSGKSRKDFEDYVLSLTKACSAPHLIVE